MDRISLNNMLLATTIYICGKCLLLDMTKAISLQPHLKSESGQPVFDISKRIIMPLEGFIQSFSVQENIVKQLIDAGVLKKEQETERNVVSTGKV